MRKEITWPAPLELNGMTRTAQQFITEMVMPRDYWRSSYELVVAADSISDELEKEGEVSKLTPDQQEKLLEGMKLRDQNIAPPAANRYFFKLMRAVHTAKDIQD